MEEYTFINKDRTRAKVFKLFKDVNNSFQFFYGMGISCEYVYKRAEKQFMKWSRVESFEDARKKYKKLLEEGLEKKLIYLKLLICNNLEGCKFLDNKFSPFHFNVFYYY